MRIRWRCCGSQGSSERARGFRKPSVPRLFNCGSQRSITPADARACPAFRCAQPAVRPIAGTQRKRSKARDLEYFAIRTFRTWHGVRLCAATARAVESFCACLNELAGVPLEGWDFLELHVMRTLREAGIKLQGTGMTPEAFEELLALLGIIAPSARGDEVEMKKEELQSEDLLGHLFGFPTLITGFETECSARAGSSCQTTQWQDSRKTTARVRHSPGISKTRGAHYPVGGSHSAVANRL